MITRTWTQPLAQWRSWLVASGRSADTRRLRLYQLRRFAEATTDPWTVTTQDLVDWLASYPHWSAETRRSHRAALVTFYSWAVRAGHITSDPTLTLPTAPPGRHLPRPAPEPVVQAALTIHDDRIRLMVALAARQGLRRGEIARIHSDDLVSDLTGWSLRVRGKGGRNRLIPLWDEIGVELASLPTGWAFPGAAEGHLSPAWVGKLVCRALPAGWTTHTLRHRFATAAYRGSRDLLAVQDLLGHAKPETTRLYVLPPADGMRDALRWAA